MKILYVITQGDFGGAQKYVFDLACSAKDRGEQIYVAPGQSKDRTLVKKLKELNIEVIELKHLVREISPWHDLVAVAELIGVYKKYQPDIIHLNSSKAGIVGSVAYSLVRKKIGKLVFTVHGWYFNEPMNRLKRLFFVWLEKIQAKAKDKFICVSDLDRKLGLENNIAKAEKLITVHNGIDIDASSYLPSADACQKLLGGPKTEGEKLIGAVANFYSTKGLAYLIDTADILINQQKQDYRFIVIGDGILRPELEAKIKLLGLNDRFLLPGRLENAKSLLPAFDVCVSSSVKEGFGFYILEVMAAGVPLVATNVGGVPEAIQDKVNGLLIESKNPDALAEAIKYMIDNPELAAKMAEQARADVLEKFSKEKMVDETWKVYNGVI